MSKCRFDTYKSFLLTLSIAFVTIVSNCDQVNAQPDWFNGNTMRGFKTDLPDFYQHQFLPGNPDGRTGWETNGGWCRETAVADSLYYWQIKGNQGFQYERLLTSNMDISMPDKWQLEAGKAIEQLDKVYNLSTGAGFKKLLSDRGHGERDGILPGQGLIFTQYVVDQGAGNGKLSYISSDKAEKKLEARLLICINGNFSMGRMS